MEIIKMCSICKIEKSLNYFYKQNKVRKDGSSYQYVNPECKECTKKRSRAHVTKPENWKKNLENRRRRENRDKENAYYRRRIAEDEELKEKYRNYRKEYRQKNKDKIKIYNANKESHKISKSEWNNCKKYFNYKCAYCGIEEHRAKLIYNQYFHKEHVIPDGRNDLKNCVPSCRQCNILKNRMSLNRWYNNKNPNYTYDRYRKIYEWLKFDCHKCLEQKS